MRSRLFDTTLIVLAAAPCLSAAELTVGPGQQYPTIAAAIAAASSGDSIRVFPGTYGPIHYGGKDLDIFSNSDNYNDTIIDGGNSQQVVWIASASAGSLRGFTIQNGNNAAGAGGGLFIYFRSPLVQNCRIRLNRAATGAGAWIQGGSPRFVDCLFSQNTVVTSGGIPPDGGGMYVDQSEAEFVNCRIESNVAPRQGGGIFVRYPYNGTLHPSFEECTIIANRASTGGGVSAWNRTEAQFSRCSILNNLAELPPSGGATKNLGGGIYVNDAGPDFISCVIADNRAGTLTATVIEGSGGGIALEESSGPVLECLVEGCTIANNKAGFATQNTGFGGGICTFTGSPAYVRSGILWGNTARTNGQQAAVFRTISGTFLTTTYCDLQGGAAAVYVPNGGYVFDNILNVNPSFVGVADYHLTGAALIDAGAPTPVPPIGSLDIDGDPRVLGTRVEMGADEFVNCTVVTPYGPLTPNTFGPGAVISLGGSTSVSANNAVLQVSGGPPNHLGIFYYGPGQTIAPLNCGNNLVSGHIQRISTAVFFDANGDASLPVDWTQPPFQGVNQITPGSSWNFQFWFRDQCSGVPSTNNSNAMHITFCP